MNDLVTQDSHPREEPDPQTRRLVDRLRAATEDMGPGLYSISSRSAPTTTERREITARADELRSVLLPAEAKEVAVEVLRLMAGYPTLRLSKEESARLAAAFVSSLAGLPLWAIRRACTNWTTGRVPESNPAFPPNAVQLKIEADRIVRPQRVEAGKIGVVLAAEVERAPTDAERDRALAYRDEHFPAVVEHADVTDLLDERRRSAHLDANDRVRRREREARGLDPAVPYTPDMERKLGDIRRQSPQPHEAEEGRDGADAAAANEPA